MLDPRIQDRSGVQFEPRAWGYLFNSAHNADNLGEEFDGQKAAPLGMTNYGKSGKQGRGGGYVN
jgi:hypothetical protein